VNVTPEGSGEGSFGVDAAARPGRGQVPPRPVDGRHVRDPGFSLSRAAFAGAVGGVALAFLAAADYHGALLYVPTQPPCWDSESVGDPEALYWLAVAGVGAGLFSLATRHWFSALIAIVANPIAFIMIAGASCAFI
jgi:hypothetical protein